MKNNDKLEISPLNLNPEDKQFITAQELNHNLKTMGWFKKIFYYLKLSNAKKQELQNFKKAQKKQSKSKKIDFNPDNVFEVKNLNLWFSYGKKQGLFEINLEIKKNNVTALIGPSGSGKSTFLRCLNKMNDLIDGVIIEGDIFYDGIHYNSKKLSSLELRTKVGMVFQKPTPFDMSIYDNVAYGPKTHGIKDQDVLDKIVEDSLKSAALWEEVKDDLDKKGTDLSGGQQQRLCIARTIALGPEVLLMDEPTSALDPIATSRIEELIMRLKTKYTIVIVTHSMTQTQRISDKTVFFYKGKINEIGVTREIFTNPKDKLTKDYILGKL